MKAPDCRIRKNTALTFDERLEKLYVAMRGTNDPLALVKLNDEINKTLKINVRDKYDRMRIDELIAAGEQAIADIKRIKQTGDN